MARETNQDAGRQQEAVKSNQFVPSPTHDTSHLSDARHARHSPHPEDRSPGREEK